MTIGEELAAARTARGLTVEEISRVTCIRASIIRGIEAGDFSGCGGTFYARGHLKTLASRVGLDPAPLLARFDAGETAGGGGASGGRAAGAGRATRHGTHTPEDHRFGHGARIAASGAVPSASGAAPGGVRANGGGQPDRAERPLPVGPGPRDDLGWQEQVLIGASAVRPGGITGSATPGSSAAASGPPGARAPGGRTSGGPGTPGATSGTFRRRRPAPPLGDLEPHRGPRWGIAAAVSLAVVVVLAAVAYVLPSRHASPPARALSRTHRVHPGPDAVTAPAPSPSPSPAPSTLAFSGVVVEVRVASEPSWLHVVNGAGTVLFQGTLQPGAVQTFRSTDQLALVIGNAGAVDLIVNGHNLGSPGPYQAVVNPVFYPGSPSATSAGA